SKSRDRSYAGSVLMTNAGSKNMSKKIVVLPHLFTGLLLSRNYGGRLCRGREHVYYQLLSIIGTVTSHFQKDRSGSRLSKSVGDCDHIRKFSFAHRHNYRNRGFNRIRSLTKNAI